MTIAIRHSVATAGAITAAGNLRKCTHLVYKMTCADYDELEARGDGCCEICGQGGKRLVLDHDHSVGGSAVRGLICDKCNAHLRRVDDGTRAIDDKTAAYLARPWHFGRSRSLSEATHATGGAPLSSVTGLSESTIRDLTANGWLYLAGDGQPAAFRSPVARV